MFSFILLTMKYVWIAVAVIVLVRIDLILHLYDKITDIIQSRPVPQVQPGELGESNQIVSIKEDQSLIQTPRSVFFTLMDDFRLNPNPEVRENAMTVLMKHPDLLRSPKDEQFEATLFRWRDHVYQREPELPNFLNDLLAIVKDENLEVVKRFYTLVLDESVENFLLVYPRTKDPNCMIAAVTGENLSAEARYTILTERDHALTSFLAQEKVDPLLRVFGSSCQMVVRVELNKLPPPVLPEDLPIPEASQP